MSQSVLFSIGVGVFATTIVAAMVVGRHAFGRIYDAQVADARAYALLAAASAAAGAVVAVITEPSVAS
jgi:hypothetical protein